MSDVLASVPTLLPWAGILGLLGVMWRTRVPLKTLTFEADKSLRADLLKQLAEQEGQHKAEMVAYEARILRLEDRIELQRETYEAKLEYERITYAGEMASFRHKVANLEQSLQLLLVLIETNPEKAQEAARRTRELREKQEIAEAAEKTAITTAKIQAGR